MEDNKVKKVLIAVPCMDMVTARFAQSLATVTKVGYSLVSFQVGSLIYDARNRLAAMAIEQNCDYIVWFDSDMTFAPDTIQRLIADLEEGRDIVSGLYFRRTPSYDPVIFSKVSVDNGREWEGYNDYPKDSIFEVEGIGLGCAAMRVSALTDILASERNLFQPVYGFGEDLSFCIRARKNGHKVWVDSRIKCGHCGHIYIDENFYQNVVGGAEHEG